MFDMPIRSKEGSYEVALLGAVTKKFEAQQEWLIYRITQ